MAFVRKSKIAPFSYSKDDKTNQVAFDVDDSGYLRHAAWAGAGTGFLVLDRNHNGLADTGEELFSNAQVADDLKRLASLFWVVANQDGIKAANEPNYFQERIAA